jgi:hypothetical protein
MRTTITLDPDTERIIRDMMRERGISFKHAVNDAIRSAKIPPKPSGVPKFKTFAMGAEQYFRWDKALATADAIEDEELIRKMALQK